MSDILRVISSSPTDVQPVFDAIAENALRLCEAIDVIIRRVEGNTARMVSHIGPVPVLAESVSISRMSHLGRVVRECRTIHIHDFRDPSVRKEYPEAIVLQHQETAYRTALIVPLVRENVVVGTIEIRRPEARAFSDKQIRLLETFAAQAVIAIENVRLFHEIQDKTRELEVASRHKSEFLASMSHELRTPLNAILGFSEVLAEQMFGEVNEKQAEYLHDIHASGAHLLSLINDILDLAKIEAGRMDLECTTFDMRAALDNALTLIRERAGRHGLKLELECDPQIGAWTADERKFKQIMLNLLSNAVKFTPAGGRIGVSASRADGALEIAVTDSGVGIKPEDQPLVFEEFRQVGGDSTAKAQGTGLGLALTKKFVELHGGSIGVQSEPGRGSTFTFRLPLLQ